MSTSQRPDLWDSGRAYEPYMGRWSRLLAPAFLRWLPPTGPATWCDVGCGTGALSHAILATEQPHRVLGVDPSEAYLAAAQRIGDPRFETRVGSAAALPASDGEFDRVVSALVLNFVPDPAAAVAEMRRVARPGGLLAACVWDYAEGMGMIRAFWDAAIALDPAAAALDEATRFPLCHPDPLRDLFTAAGLREVSTATIEIDTTFADFADYWHPFLGGQAPAPGYCTSLPENRRATLREHLRATLPTAPDGTLHLPARALAIRGTAP